MEVIKLEESYRNLSAAVILQAFRDLKSNKLSERFSAKSFFKNADFTLYADILKIGYDAILEKYGEAV